MLNVVVCLFFLCKNGHHKKKNKKTFAAGLSRWAPPTEEPLLCRLQASHVVIDLHLAFGEASRFLAFSFFFGGGRGVEGLRTLRFLLFLFFLDNIMFCLIHPDFFNACPGRKH